MDISVSGLNGRLASKLPPELPLGLVFVVGQVEQLDADGFILAEGTHRLHCRTKNNGQVGEGDEVRASGHLMFDAEQLRYYLLARDIEVVTSEPLGTPDHSSRELLAESEGLLSALAAVKARAAVAPAQTGEDLPVWVRKLAPPEVQAAEVETSQPQATPAELDKELVSTLSEAMDSEEDLELTPEFLARYMPEEAKPPESPEPEEPLAEATVSPEQSIPQEQEPEMEEPLAELSTSYRPVNRQDTDWLVILLIISFFVLTIAAIVTIVLLLVQ